MVLPLVLSRGVPTGPASGLPPVMSGGYPQDTIEGTPFPRRQGQYASSGQAGGLSCLRNKVRSDYALQW